MMASIPALLPTRHTRRAESMVTSPVGFLIVKTWPLMVSVWLPVPSTVITGNEYTFPKLVSVFWPVNEVVGVFLRQAKGASRI